MSRKTSGQKARDKCRAKYGEDFYKRIGAIGGLAKNPNKGFGSHPELAKEMGRKYHRGKTRKMLESF